MNDSVYIAIVVSISMQGNTMPVKSFTKLFTRAIVLFSAISMINFAVTAATLDQNQLKIIQDTAASICISVKDARGDKTQMQIQGDVSAKLQGLIGKLADAGVSGKGSLSRESFNGLTQDATAIALEGDRQCRERLFNKMFDKLSTNEEQNLFSASFVGDQFWIDNRDYEVVNGALSSITFKIDGRDVGQMALNTPFEGITEELSPGKHTFTYVARIRSKDSNSRINQSCSTTFNINSGATFNVYIKFSKYDDERGTISKCSLKVS